MADIIAIVSIVVIIGLAYIKNSLKKNALLLAFFIGLILYYSGGYSLLIGLYVFFISSSIVSKIKKEKKMKREESDSNRGFKQVMASGFMVALMAFLYLITKQEVFRFISFVSLAVANADTWASEIGVLSKHDPMTLIPLKKGKKGISGGVSILGLWASLLGAFLIGLVSFYFGFSLEYLWLITMYGFIGALVDSILGSTCQALYYNALTKEYSETKLDSSTKIKGFSWCSNEMVNLLSNAIICIFLYLMSI